MMGAGTIARLRLATIAFGILATGTCLLAGEGTVGSPPAQVFEVSAGNPALWNSSLRLAIEIREDGIYRLSAAQAAATGWEYPVDLARLRLLAGGREVPLGVESTDGRWDGPDDPDTIWFFGRMPRGKSTRLKPGNVHLLHFLVLDDANATPTAPPKRFVPSPDSPPKADCQSLTYSLYRDHHERDFNYMPFPYSGEETDFFFYNRITPATDPAKLTYKFWVSRYYMPKTEEEFAKHGAPRIRVRMFGISEADNDPDHQVEIWLNDSLLGTASWEGRTRHDFETTLTLSMLRDENELAFRVSEDRLFTVDDIGLDWFEIVYPMQFRAPLDEILPLSPGLVREGGAYRFSSHLWTLGDVRLLDVISGGMWEPVDRVNYGDTPEKTRQSVTFEFRAPRDDGASGGDFDGGPYLIDAARWLVVHMDRTRPLAASAIHPMLARPPDARTALETLKAHGVTPPPHILIYHRSLAEEARAHAAYRAGRGTSTLLVDVEEILAAEDPHAWVSEVTIRDYLRDYYEGCTAAGYPAPHTVTLLGDATFDYHGIYNDREEFQISANLIPTHWYEHPGWYLSGFAEDNFFVRFEEGSLEPSMAIGRIPAATPKEARDYFEKVREYEAAPAGTDWKNRALLVSSWENSFANLLEEVKRRALVNMDATMLIAELKSAEDDVMRMRDALNEGCGVLYYVGHGGSFVWRVGPVDYERQKDLFTPASIASLTNEGRYPIVLVSSCYSASFNNRLSLGESFIFEPRRGAIAVIGSPWKTSVTPNHVINLSIMLGLYSPEWRGPTTDPVPLGEVFRRVKVEQKVHGEAMTGFTLLGDPLLEVLLPPKRPEPDTSTLGEPLTTTAAAAAVGAVATE